MQYTLFGSEGTVLAKGNKKKMLQRISQMPDGYYLLRGPKDSVCYLNRDGKVQKVDSDLSVGCQTENVSTVKLSAQEHPMVSMGVDASDEEIAAVMRAMASRDIPFQVGIHGFGGDLRELWEISEVLTLCKRLVKLGFTRLLVGSTCSKEIAADLAVHPGDGWGALEVWAVAVGLMRGFHVEYTADDLERFSEHLREAERGCDTVCGASWKWN